MLTRGGADRLRCADRFAVGPQDRDVFDPVVRERGRGAAPCWGAGKAVAWRRCVPFREFSREQEIDGATAYVLASVTIAISKRLSFDAGVVENMLSPAYRGADVTLLFAAKAALVAVP